MPGDDGVNEERLHARKFHACERFRHCPESASGSFVLCRFGDGDDIGISLELKEGVGHVVASGQSVRLGCDAGVGSASCAASCEAKLATNRSGRLMRRDVGGSPFHLHRASPRGMFEWRIELFDSKKNATPCGCLPDGHGFSVGAIGLLSC